MLPAITSASTSTTRSPSPIASRPPPEKGQARYVGVEACTDCHDDARKVWDKTPHAHAYATLQKDFKEYNLDCVSCHVTGYDKPGGSTVTYNEKLQNVQCEKCHGPGSLHAKAPEQEGPHRRQAERRRCCARRATTRRTSRRSTRRRR